jgi:peptidoglycan hydrolase-like protein with peptidoglycan-binding domain
MARFALPCLIAALVAVVGIGCSKQSVEERARAEAEKIQKDIGDPDAAALAQQVDPAVVKEAQRQLTAINEYQGAVDGTIDSVTVNAIQSFQRTAGLKDDGMLTPDTRSKLAAAAAQSATAKQ